MRRQIATHLRPGPSTFPRHLSIVALTIAAVALVALALLEAAVIRAADPVLTFVEVQKDGVGGVDGLDGANSVTISPDGKHLYASSWVDDAVAVFSRNSTTGSLTFVEAQRDGVGGVDGLDSANSVTVSPDGKHLYAAGGRDDAVAVFSRNSTTGALTFVEVHKDGVGEVDGLDAVQWVTISPDGKHLYAAGANDNAVAVFRRNSATGALTFVEVQRDGADGVDGLWGAWSVTVSPDGKHLYSAGPFDHAMAVFNRNSTTGALTFVEAHKDGVDGVDGLDATNEVTVSPDGKHLYVADRNDSAVAVFSRNSTTGALTFVEVHKDGVDGVDGLFAAYLVAVSPDGIYLYAAGKGDDAVAVFSRNSTTGALTFVEVHKDGVGGIDGLDGAVSVTVSPDGKHLYAASILDDAVAVFSVAPFDLAAATAAAQSGDTINIPAGTHTVATELVIDKDLTLVGAGASSTIIQASAVNPVQTPDDPTVADHRVFRINSGNNVAISGVTIRHGKPSAHGGGIYNSGTLTLTSSTISGNTPGSSYTGGGIYNRGMLTLTNSTVSGNSAGNDGGGVFNNFGTLALTNSTVSGNNVTGPGGGIYNNSGTVTITSSTVSGNIATTVAGGIINNQGTVTLTNTIIAGNTAFSYPDCTGSSLTSQGHNLVQDTSGCTISGDLTGNLTGMDPLLGSLQDNGGPTHTHALLAGSPAIDAGDDAGAPATDQRGVKRPQGSQSDIGAFELEIVALNADLSVSKSVDDASPQEGDTVTFTVTVTNNGPDTATGVVVSDVIPSGLTLQSATSSDGAYSTTTGNWTLATSLASGASTTLTLVTVVESGTASSTITNTAAITASDQADPDTGNNTDSATVTVSSAPTPHLTFVQVVKDGVGGVDGLLRNSSVTVSPDGKHLYAASRDDDAVAVFSRDSTSGELTFVEVVKDGVGGVDGLDGANSVTVSPDGKHIYAAGQFDDAVAVFSRNSTTGELTFVEVEKDGVGGVDGLDFAHSVTVSPDGKHIYPAGTFDHAVAVFSRNLTTGELTFVEVERDGVGGVDGLGFAISVTVSPDGKHIYAAGQLDDAVAVFSRNPTTGELTFVQVVKDGVGGVDGLLRNSSVTVSPDGKHLYAASRDDDAVAVFSRDSTTGELTFVEVEKDGEGGVDGLDHAWSVTVSPDGKHLYAAGVLDDAVAVFNRNPTTGELTFVEVQKDGVGGVDGLDAAWSVTVSPDGKHLYAAGANDDAVAVFSVNVPPPASATCRYDLNSSGTIQKEEAVSAVTDYLLQLGDPAPTKQDAVDVVTAYLLQLTFTCP